MSTTLILRIISALAGVAILLGGYWYFGTLGLCIISLLVSTLAIFEVAKLVLPADQGIPEAMRGLFIFLAALTLSITIFWQDGGFACFAIANLVMLSVFILLKGFDEENLDNLLRWEAASVLGLFYSAVMPAFVIKILSYREGDKWFATYLAIVFAGDTFAYFAGRLWGNRKLMSAISPSKTVAGAIGGVAGSVLVGLGAYFLWFPTANLFVLLLVTVFTAFFAQTGDLFESLIKRVAHVKDSGNIMPGHGGILDRLDGIYFAAPLFFVAIRFLD